MKIYLVYLILKGFDRRFDYLVNRSTIQYNGRGYLISLYGICSRKEEVKKFLEVRDKRMFEVFTKKVNKKEFQELLVRYPLAVMYEIQLNGCDKEMVYTGLEIEATREEYEYELEACIERYISPDSLERSTDPLIDIETAVPWKDKKKRKYVEGDKGSIYQIIVEWHEDDYIDQFDRWVKFFSPILNLVKLQKFLGKENKR